MLGQMNYQVALNASVFLPSPTIPIFSPSLSLSYRSSMGSFKMELCHTINFKAHEKWSPNSLNLCTVRKRGKKVAIQILSHMLGSNDPYSCGNTFWEDKFLVPLSLHQTASRGSAGKPSIILFSFLCYQASAKTPLVSPSWFMQVDK